MYESFYGLSGKPFQLSPDPDFFFGSRGHRRAMAYLEYGLHQAEGFIVVTGEVGAGKTTLVQQMLRRLPPGNIVPVQIVTTQLEADDLVRVVASSFGLQIDLANKATLLIRLEQHLRQLQAEGRRALLIVDEAQNLGAHAIEELRMLSNFQIGTKAALQSFLIGQPELRDLMQRPEMRQLKQRIIAAYHLGPLDQPETRDYIRHRLGHVGWKNHPTFDDSAFDRVFASTHGIPRRINTLTDRLLLSGFLAEKHTLSGEDVVEVAKELRMELGPGPVISDGEDTALTPAKSPAGRYPGAPEFPEISERNDTHPDWRLAEHTTLEERIEVLESATSAMLGTLKKILRLLRSSRSDISRGPAE